ncbi:MAG: bifunctional enoyl-CoA hydratase/phosphate acetyltransferase [Saccharofermentanales bacterium]|mgnify:CR=1 FL=1|jgi:phosphate butyryltransferase|nr:bifunctional enoyl-CoA hydratase/phosphate acetyltransferase [Eubacteriales bacterium]MDD3611402.1 bifunctional enoyl-CoA hydratase/phosphate acetyltransferase [Eubacteriales bacterium]
MTIDFSEMGRELRQEGNSRIALVCAEEMEALRSVLQAYKEGLAEPILIGAEEGIRDLAERESIALDGIEILDEADPQAAAHLGVHLVRTGQADAIMKGLVKTSLILKAVLNKETGIRSNKLLSHIAVFNIPQLGRSLMISDAALCIAPNLAEKRNIIQNAVEAMHLLGYERPKVACLCAVESVNPAMPATVDAAELVRLNRSGEIGGCDVGGPFALDNALFPEAAELKGLDGPVAGRSDILLMPNIEVGNALYKSLAFLQNLPVAGAIVGAKAPVIITSRADSQESKHRSIILSLYLAKKQKERV